MRIALSLIASAALLAGCGEKAPDNAVAEGNDTFANIEEVPENEVPVEGNEADLPMDEPASFDGWFGKWTGPEGTYLTLARGSAPGAVTVTIADLDGPKRFEGTTGRDTIAFTRNGVRETLRPANGDQTGMKWLAGKADCLMVKPGEGWCRD